MRTSIRVRDDGGRFNMDFILKQEVSDSNAFEIKPTHNTNINLVTFFGSLTCPLMGRTRRARVDGTGPSALQLTLRSS